MTDQLTRRELLQRGAAGGAALTIPGLLAACGGTSKAGAGSTTSHKLAKTRPKIAGMNMKKTGKIRFAK